MERIVCAAIKFKFNALTLVIPSIRHFDHFTHEIIGAIDPVIWGKRDRSQEVQGFLTNTRRFVDRVEAKQIALTCGQILDTGREELFSEDLY